MKTNKYTNYSFSLLIVYGSSYMFRHYIAILRERSIDCSSIEHLSEGKKALGTLPEDDNVMPKHVGGTIHDY
jgi:hypothetical protein